MKYLKIQNKGEIEIRLIALMGGTTKADKPELIGNFGSGLKYVLAFLFRNNLDFHIFSGTKEIKVHTEQEIIRTQVFDIICIEGNRTSITANMGKDWLPWMIVRELYANSLDEGNSQKEVTTVVEGMENTTCFYIQISKEIQDVLDNWNKYFLENELVISENQHRKIYRGGDTLRLYKQGILIYENTEEKSMFAYDNTQAEINELREFRGNLDWEIVYFLIGAEEKAIKYFLENAEDSYYETKLDYIWNHVTFNDNWRKVIGNSKLIYPEAVKSIKERGIEYNPNDYVVVPKQIYKALTKQFEGIGALRTSSDSHAFYENYNEHIENHLSKALAILETCEYTMHPELEFRYGFFEDKNIMARINMKDKVICISQTILNKPLFDTVSILIEENEHFLTGFSDNSREFQQHFIDLYTRELLHKNEIEV